MRDPLVTASARCRAPLLVALALSAVACSVEPPLPADAGRLRPDATTEAPGDADLPDATTEAPADASDAPADATSGSADTGAPADAAAPFEADAGPGDAGPPDAGTARPDASSCAVRVAAPDEDPWSVRLPSAGFGGTASASSGGHQDVFLQSAAPANYTRVGVRLDWGGTIVFWGLGADPASNTIDANDTGREVQIALYDPERNRQSCAWDASCLSTSASCGNSITYLGWDPVQGGDECNRGATATWSVVGDALRVEVTPVQWNPDWDATDCRNSACSGAARAAQVRYTTDLRFVDPLVVELSLQVLSLESFAHGATGQEFPTVYVAHGSGGPDLPLLLDAAGQAVAIDVPANDGFTMKDFVSPKPYVTFQNALRDYGVGLAMDQGVTGFQGWAGDGAAAPYFHNVRAHLAFGLAAGATVRGRAYLALGSLSTVQATLDSLLARRPPFGAVDQPPAGATARGPSIPVAGWALDTAHLASVSVEIDGVPAATLPISTPRPDVCAAYPAYAGCPGVGFSGAVPTGSLDDCVHLMKVVATDADGNRTVLGERLVQR